MKECMQRFMHSEIQHQMEAACLLLYPLKRRLCGTSSRYGPCGEE